MKKKLIFIIVGLLFSAMVFAEHQTTLNYSLGGYSVQLKGDFDSKLTYGFQPFGLACSNQWFKNSEEPKRFDVGFDVKFGMWLSGGQKFDSTNSSDWFNVGEYISLGPVFRICANEKNFIFITPGLQGDFTQGFYTGDDVTSGKTLDLDLALSLDFAYRHWVNEHYGLNLGFDMDIPLAGYYNQSYTIVTTRSDTYYADGSTGTGFAYRFLIGCSIR